MKNNYNIKRLMIGVDVDDVIGDCVTSLLEFHNEKYGSDYKYPQVLSFSLSKLWGGTPEETHEKIAQFYESNYLIEMIPIEGALEALQILAVKHSLIAITARTEEIKDKTHSWIGTHFPGIFRDIFLTSASLGGTKMKKSQICLTNQVNLMIDDSLENARDCAEHGIKVFLMDRPWNQEELPNGVERIFSWKEILKKIEN